MRLGLQWDIFCRVIDNHGDLGVCWRLSSDLASRGERVRLWVDDATALEWMAPAGTPGVELKVWAEATSMSRAPEPASDVLVEAFGCDIPEAFLRALAAARKTRGAQPAWLNLEYLSAEAYVERSHTLPSPVMAGPARGWTKRFFYPGFSERTGGLLREPDLDARRQAFDANAWLAGLGMAAEPAAFRCSLFCYEPKALAALLDQWQLQGHLGRPVQLLVTAGRAAAAVQAWQRNRPETGRLTLQYLPHLSQRDYDHLLWSCELNFVRGEDSLVRALWAGVPLVWQIYPQDDGAHHPKLQAFLDRVQATPEARAWHAAWNLSQTPTDGVAWTCRDAAAWAAWQQQAARCRAQLCAQRDLVSQLLGFVAESS